MTFLTTLEKSGVVIPQTYLESVDFISNSCIMRQGDPGDGCYIIDEGTVRLRLEDSQTGRDTALATLEVGSVLGEFSLLDNKPRSASAYADSHVKARWFSRKSFEEMCKRDPIIALRIALALGEDLASKMRGLNGKIGDYIFGREADQETRKILSSDAAEEVTNESVQERARTAARLYGWEGFSGL